MIGYCAVRGVNFVRPGRKTSSGSRPRLGDVTVSEQGFAEKAIIETHKPCGKFQLTGTVVTNEAYDTL